jgi:hypothetical protein
VDRQRRAPALIAPIASRAASGWGPVLLSLTFAFGAISLSGCRNRKEEARQRAELTGALDQYKTQIGELQKQVSGLRARFDKLPEDLPGIEPVRDDLHALEEVLGVEDGHTKWLSGELDKALASGKRAEIDAVRNAIPQGNDATPRAIVKLAHQLLPLERLANQRRFFESLDAKRSRDARNEQSPKTR